MAGSDSAENMAGIDAGENVPRDYSAKYMTALVSCQRGRLTT
jgi:hypothetical protein